MREDRDLLTPAACSARPSHRDDDLAGTIFRGEVECLVSPVVGHLIGEASHETHSSLTGLSIEKQSLVLRNEYFEATL